MLLDIAGGALGQVVDCADRIPFCQQSTAKVRTHKACRSCNQHFSHRHLKQTDQPKNPRIATVTASISVSRISGKIGKEMISRETASATGKLIPSGT